MSKINNLNKIHRWNIFFIKIQRVALVFLLVLFSLAWISQVRAADWYVRPSGGSGSGSNWTAAWNGLGGINWASVAAGDTIWVAGGNYTQLLRPSKSGTSTNRIYIRRARGDAPECTGAEGWSSSFDSTVQQTGGAGIVMGNYSYITISGRTTAAGGSHGWHINFSGRSGGNGIEWPNGATGSFVLIEYMDVQGPGTITYSSDGRGIDDTPFSSATDHTFSHMKIWNWESGVYVVGVTNPTFEHIEMFDIMATNWSQYHPNGIYTSSCSGGIVRYSKFYKKTYGVGEGIFFEQAGGCSNWKIYGNLFYDLNQSGWKAIEITSSVPNLKIWNNTFDNVLSPLYTQASPGSGAELKNNLFYQSGTGYSWGTTSNNLQINSGAIFVDRAAKNYHIVETTSTNYPRNAGVALTSDGYINKDMDNNTRGADGAWDVGAFEFGSGSQSGGSEPEQPKNLKLVD